MDGLHKQIVPDVHAYLLEGWWSSLDEILGGAIEKSLGKGARVIPVAHDTLGIDDVRSVTELATRHATAPDVFVLGCRSVTREAQNALLKVCEEPTENTYFFVVVPFARVLLPTLRSRLLLLTHKAEVVPDELVETFLRSRSSKRLEMLEHIIKEKDKKTAHVFLDTLLEAVYTKCSEVGGGYQALEEIMRARQFLSARGASLKLLLEHVALVVPQKSKV